MSETPSTGAGLDSGPDAEDKADSPVAPVAPVGPAAPHRAPTFRGRLTMEAMLLSLAVLAVAGVLVFAGSWRALSQNLDTTLLSIARTEIASALDAPDRGIHVHEDVPALVSLPIGAGYEKFAQIENEYDRVVACTANLRTAPGITTPVLETDPLREREAREGNPSFATIQIGGQSCRALYYPLVQAGRPGWVAIIAIPDRPLRRSLQALLGTLAFSLALGGGAAAFGAGHLARRLTSPLQSIASAAVSVSSKSMPARIPDISPDQELRDVTDVLNQMLGRLEAEFQEKDQMVAAQRRFIADASHELRSPLASLRGTVEVALRRPRSDEEYRETLCVALTEVQRLCRLVDDLLTLSRADTGRFGFNLGPVDIAEILCQSAVANEAEAERAGIRLAVDAPGPLRVGGDMDRLRQVVDNLVSNAVRYAPSGSRVLLRAAVEGADVRVCVKDHGPGLPEDEQAHVFDRFYRADLARARHSGGMGLGLAIVKAIVEAHGGHVGVTSIPGQGATFWFTIPAI